MFSRKTAAMVTRLPNDQRRLLLELFKGECAYCSNLWEEWDHIRPWYEWGMTTFNNIVPACKSCNCSKGKKDLEVWAAAKNRQIKPAVYDVKDVPKYNHELSLVRGKLKVTRVRTSLWRRLIRRQPTFVSARTQKVLRGEEAFPRASRSTLRPPNSSEPTSSAEPPLGAPENPKPMEDHAS